MNFFCKKAQGSEGKPRQVPEDAEEAQKRAAENVAIDLFAQKKAQDAIKLEKAPAYRKAQIEQDPSVKDQVEDVQGDRKNGESAAQGAQEIVAQAQEKAQTQADGEAGRLEAHGGGHQPKRREKKPPSRRDSSYSRAVTVPSRATWPPSGVRSLSFRF